MTSSSSKVRRGRCEWCGSEFVAAASGPVGRYCSPAHRQAAYRARHVDRGRPATDGRRLDERLDELARVLETPGDEAQLALWAVAADVIAASGRTVADEIVVTTPLGAAVGPRRAARPSPWNGRRLARPSAGGFDRVYTRAWDDDWGGFQVTVTTFRPNGSATGSPKALWLRRHRAGDHVDWRRAYDWTDEFNVPDAHNLRTLGSDLIADAVDLRGGGRGLGHWHDPVRLVRHFVGDVLWGLGDTPWALRRGEVINWLDLHEYLEPVT